MSGQRGQRGPHFLKCSQCKKQRDDRGSARTGKLFRTGRERPSNCRTSKIAYECKCAECNHVGWYAHEDALRLPIHPSIARDFEPGFVEACDGLRRLQRQAERHSDATGPMKLWAGQLICLVDAALALLDRSDVKRAKAQLLQNFRYRVRL